MPTEETKAVIVGGLRTLAQLVPIAGSAVAQAWSEYENFQQKQRVDEFMRDFTERLKHAEETGDGLKERVEKMEDLAKLLEDTVRAVQRETDDLKRSLYPRFLVNVIVRSSEVSAGDRAYILDTIEYLTTFDIEILKRFDATGWSRGDLLTNTRYSSLPVTGKDKLNAKAEKRFTPILTSTAKLEARGLLIVVPNSAPFNFAGSADEWYNVFRARSWNIMPIGRALLRSLE